MTRFGTEQISKPMPGAQLDRSHPAAAGLQACWLFNENTGPTAYDSAGNGYHFALTGGVTRTATPYGPAITFDGSTGQGISTGTPLSGATQFTVILQHRVPSGNPMIFLTTSTAFNASLFTYFDTGGLTMFVNAAEPFNKSTPFPASGVFDHMVMTFSGSSLTNLVSHWHNGILSATAAATVASIGAHTALYIGKDLTGANATNGTLESLKIYSRVLSPAEIEADYENPYAMFAAPNARRFYSIPGVASRGSGQTGLGISTGKLSIGF